MRCIAVLAVLAALACSRENALPPKVAASVPMAPAAVAPQPPNPPPFDLSFESQEQVVAWTAKVVAQAEAEKTLPNPKPFLAALSAFKPPARVTALFDPPVSVVEAGDPPGYKPDPAEAKRLEREGEHWEAGRIYARLKDTAGLRRCADELKKKGEWTVVAYLAANLGDQKLFDLAFDTLAKSDQESRSMSVAAYAVRAGHKDFVEAAYTRHSMEFSDTEAEMMARAGWLEPLRARLHAAFEDPEFPDLGTAGTLRRIFAAKFEGKEILLKYLQRPDAEVLLYNCHCGGEGMSETDVLVEAEELWKAVRSGGFGTLYAAAVKRQFSAPRPTEDGSVDYEALDAEHVVGKLVHLFDGARKDPAWANVLAAGLADASPYVREVGRLALGLKANSAAQDLRPNQRYVVAWLSGASPNPADLDGRDVEDLGLDDVFGILARGTLVPAEAKRLWKLVDLPEETDALRVDAKDQAAAFAQLADLEEGNADVLRARLVRSGAGAKALPDTVRFGYSVEACRVNSDAALDCALAYRRTAFAALSTGIAWDGTTEWIARALQARIEHAWSSYDEWHTTMLALLLRPYTTANKNILPASRLADGSVPPKCSNRPYADGLVLTLTGEFRTLVSGDAFEDLLLDLRRAGYNGPYDAEVGRRVKTNDIAGLARLRAPQ